MSAPGEDAMLTSGPFPPGEPAGAQAARAAGPTRPPPGPGPASRAGTGESRRGGWPAVTLPA
eukprot:15411621-Alexandrium_andersonii.AAC.1